MQTWDVYLRFNNSMPRAGIDQKIENGSFPPEFTMRDLINPLNAICPGKYDFAYNRIDFRHNQSELHS
jgi:hypothetical protein